MFPLHRRVPHPRLLRVGLAFGSSSETRATDEMFTRIPIDKSKSLKTENVPSVPIFLEFVRAIAQTTDGDLVAKRGGRPADAASDSRQEVLTFDE
jgi:hypothetical protein